MSERDSGEVILSFLLGGFLSNISYIWILFGLICLICGWLGLWEENRKYGVKLKSTNEGVLSVIIGFVCFGTITIPLICIPLGIITLTLSKKAINNGDNKYGKDGGIIGAIAIILSVFLYIYSYYYYYRI